MIASYRHTHNRGTTSRNNIIIITVNFVAVRYAVLAQLAVVMAIGEQNVEVCVK